MQQNHQTPTELLSGLNVRSQGQNATVATLDKNLISSSIGSTAKMMPMLKTAPFSQPMSLLIVLQSRTAELTINCLHSLANELRSPSSKVVVIDRNADHGSMAQIAAAISANDWHQWVELIPLERRNGSAPGDNAAMRSVLEAAASYPHVLLLKPDTVVHPGALQALLDLMVVPSAVNTANNQMKNHGSLQQAALHASSVMSERTFNLRLGVMSKLLLQWAGLLPIAGRSGQTNRFSGADMILITFDRSDYQALVMRWGRVAHYTLPVNQTNHPQASIALDAATYFYALFCRLKTILGSKAVVPHAGLCD